MALNLHLTYKLSLIVRFEKIDDLSTGIVNFYTVGLGNDEEFEFEKFDAKEFQNPNHNEELQIIYDSIEKMKIRGALAHYFKPEGPANALPKVDKLMMQSNEEDFGLRLYCIRLRVDLVVLLNGDIKTKLNPRECPNVAPHFDKAIRIALSLEKAERNQFVSYCEKGIEFDEGFELEI